MITILLLAACSPDRHSVDTTTYTEEVACDGQRAYWQVPEPPPLIVQAMEEGDDYTGWVAVGTSGPSGTVVIPCGSDTIVVSYIVAE